jgi:hypothetical protein
MDEQITVYEVAVTAQLILNASKTIFMIFWFFLLKKGEENIGPGKGNAI